jgi:hypothetical protein
MISTNDGALISDYYFIDVFVVNLTTAVAFDCMASNGTMLVNHELGRLWKEASVP